MLDIGLSELLVVGGVALIVLGPEKLAVVARTSGKWAGKAQRYVNDVKADIAREGELAELRKLKSDMELAGQDIRSSLQTTAADVNADLAALQASGTANTTADASEHVSAQMIQASLDSTSHPNEHLIPPAVHDPLALQLDLDALQSDFYALEVRMTQLRTQLGTALSQSGKSL